MNGTPETPDSPSQSAAPEGLQMRQCKNCPEQFAITSRTPASKEFCTSKCRMEFFQHGNTPLKVIRKTVENYLKKAGKEELSALLAKLLRSRELRKTIAAAGFIHRSQLRRPIAPRVSRLERRIDRIEQRSTTRRG